MKFYNREPELKELKRIYKLSQKKAHLVVVKGRRRVGKTTLVLESLQNKKYLYLFVAKKKPKLLLEDFEKELARAGISFVGHLNSFDDFFEIIFQYSRNKPLIVVLDEFQNFKYTDSSVFSVLQKHWDLNKSKSKIAIVIIGSMMTMMKKIFLSAKEPLFGRTTNTLEIQSLKIQTIKEVAEDLNLVPKKNLLYYYAIFGGTPKYYDLIDAENLHGKSLQQVLSHLIFRKEGELKQEGDELLIEEFGKNYFTYFSILEAIARGRNKLTEIADIVGISVSSIGKYLDELEKYYQIIERRNPIFSKPTSRLGRYYIKDNFLRFWFRYVYKNKGLLEQDRFQEVMSFMNKNLSTFTGPIFEDMIIALLIELNKIDKFLFKFDTIGKFWGRAEFDIDIVASNAKTSEIFFAECKLSSKQANLSIIRELQNHAKQCNWHLKNRKEHFGLFVSDKMPIEKKKNFIKQGVYVWELAELI